MKLKTKFEMLWINFQKDLIWVPLNFTNSILVTSNGTSKECAVSNPSETIVTNWWVSDEWEYHWCNFIEEHQRDLMNLIYYNRSLKLMYYLVKNLEPESGSIFPLKSTSTGQNRKLQRFLSHCTSPLQNFKELYEFNFFHIWFLLFPICNSVPLCIYIDFICEFWIILDPLSLFVCIEHESRDLFCTTTNTRIWYGFDCR